MASKIKEFNFSNCQHLRKILVGGGVEFTGTINLKDTAVEEKNDVAKILESEEFKNIPSGLTTSKNNFGRFKLKSKTTETQTETPEILPLKDQLLNLKDKEVLSIMKECLFWYDEFEDPKRKQYLVEKQTELKNSVGATTTIPLNSSVKLLGEHILLILEKLTENADIFAELKKKEKLDLEPRSWTALYLWLISDMVWKYDERFWQWRTTSDLVYKLVYKQIDRVLYRSPSDDKTGSDRMTLHKELINFMDSLHDTVFRKGGSNIVFPTYDENRKTLGDIFDNNKTWCGKDTSDNKMSEQAFSVFRGIFQEWKKITPIPPKETPVLTLQELTLKNKELQTQLDKLRLLFNSSYPSWWNWIKLRIINEDYSLRDDKKADYPNLSEGDFKAIEKTIQSGALSNEVNPDITKPWTENIPPTTKFLSILSGKEAYPLEKKTYDDLGKIFDKWRSKLYILNELAEGSEINKLKTKVKEMEEKLPQGWDDTTTTLDINSLNKTQFYDKINNKWLDNNWGLKRYRSLTTLNCYSNSLTSLPTLPSNLTTLNCQNNSLTSLPTLPSNLTTLYCYSMTNKDFSANFDIRKLTKLSKDNGLAIDWDTAITVFYHNNYQIYSNQFGNWDLASNIKNKGTDKGKLTIV